MKNYFVTFKCTNLKCGDYDKETEPIHSDLLNIATIMVKQYSKQKQEEIQYPKTTCVESVCSVCKYQMEETSCEPTDEVVKDYPYYAMSATNKKSRNYWTRWETSLGGRPKFRPVSDTGGDGGGKINPLE
jgi:hypothetical protein